MAVVEYTKCKNEFLVTDYKEDGRNILKLRFPQEKRGVLHINGEEFRIENGVATVKVSLLAEGVHIPLLKKEDGSFICDSIRVEAGVVTPEIYTSERILKLTQKIISAEERVSYLEEKISGLCDAVYGKSIL